MSILKQVVIRKTLIIVNQNTVWNTFLALMVFVFGSFLPLSLNSSPVQLLLPRPYLLLIAESPVTLSVKCKEKGFFSRSTQPSMTPKVDGTLPEIRSNVEGRAVKSKIEIKVGFRHFIHLVSCCSSMPQQHGRNLLIVILGLF